MITLNCNGRLLSLHQPVVMGILNVTPDSFFDGGKYLHRSEALRQVERMATEGATLIDVGGMSTRPGAALIAEADELRRVLPVVAAVVQAFPEVFVSVDTVRARVAAESVAAGAHLVNDISAGSLDPLLIPTVASLGVPYVLMHMQGEPLSMQHAPTYSDVIDDVLAFFVNRLGVLREAGIKDVIADVGFGFGKTIAHNYQLLRNMHVFRLLDVPLLAGVSRKSMIYKVLNIKPQEALNGTTALHLVALQQGAAILRAHDVREAVQTIRLWQELEAAAVG